MTLGVPEFYRREGPANKFNRAGQEHGRKANEEGGDRQAVDSALPEDRFFTIENRALALKAVAPPPATWSSHPPSKPDTVYYVKVRGDGTFGSGCGAYALTLTEP